MTLTEGELPIAPNETPEMPAKKVSNWSKQVKERSFMVEGKSILESGGLK